MAQRVCIIGGGVIGLATAYALVREGFDVSVIEARPTLGSQTSFANGGQLSYRYVAPLADAGVPLQALGWMLRGDSPLKLRPRMDPAQWRWLASFVAACRGSHRAVCRRQLFPVSGHALECFQLPSIDAQRQKGQCVDIRAQGFGQGYRRAQATGHIGGGH